MNIATDLNNWKPETYGDMYTVGNQYFAKYSRLMNGELITCRDLITVIGTRFTKTFRVNAQLHNHRTGETFWSGAKEPHTPCEHLMFTAGAGTVHWWFDGKR